MRKKANRRENQLLTQNRSNTFLPGKKDEDNQTWYSALQPDGFKMPGLAFPSSFSNQVKNLMFLFGCLNFLPLILGANNQSYFFRSDEEGILYRLLFSGAEDIGGTVISQLKKGHCNTTTAGSTSATMDLVEAYYPYGRTVDNYVAQLLVEKGQKAESFIHECVSELIKEGHDKYKDKVNSPKTVGIVLAVFFGIAALIAVGASIAVYRMGKKRQEFHPNEDTRLVNLSAHPILQ